MPINKDARPRTYTKRSNRPILKSNFIQRRIQDLVKHLLWSLSVRIVNEQKPLIIFAEKLDHIRVTGS